MNTVFATLVMAAFATTAWRQVVDDDSEAMLRLGRAMLDDASGAVTLALGLVGAMALFLGALKVGEAAGLLTAAARVLQPLLIRLFPDVPARHPAMGAMVMNVAANLFGLGNAATPFGIRAMQQLDTLNPAKGTASDAMVLFLAINTAGVTLLPTSVIALRAAAGSANPAGIVPTTLFATGLSMAVAIGLAKVLGRWWPVPAPIGNGALSAVNVPVTVEVTLDAVPTSAAGPWTRAIAAGLVALLLLLALAGQQAAAWIIPALVTALLAAGALRGVPVYERFVDGASEAFAVAVRIIPYLVAILFAVGMLRASGALDAVITPLAVVTEPLGLPAEALLMTLLRTLSGSGAFAYLASVLRDPAIGPDSYTGYLVSTIQASTETTFYVLAVYFGSVGVRRMRHAVIAGLGADAAGAVGAVLACQLLAPG